MSGIYVIPLLSNSREWIVEFKHAYFIFVLILILIKVNLKDCLKNIVSIILLLLIFLYAVNFIVRREYFHDYFQQIFQILFIFALFNYTVQQKSQNFYLSIINFFKPKYIFLISLLSIFLCLLSTIASHFFLTGAGNGKNLFSLWLSQYICLIFLNKSSNLEDFCSRFFIKIEGLKNIIYSIPLILIQTYIGSKTGLIFSFLLIFYFLINTFSFRSAFLKTFLIIFISMTFNFFLRHNNEDVGFTLSHYNKVSNYYSDIKYPTISEARLDTTLSGRYELCVSAVKKIFTKDIFLFGTGTGNFKFDSFVPELFGRSLDVHNVYLRTFGEYGIFGFLLIMVLLFYPIIVFLFSNLKNFFYRDAFFIMLFSIISAMLQPAYLIYSISPCLLFWIIYSEFFRRKINLI